MIFVEKSGRVLRDPKNILTKCPNFRELGKTGPCYGGKIDPAAVRNCPYYGGKTGPAAVKYKQY